VSSVLIIYFIAQLIGVTGNCATVIEFISQYIL